MVGAGSVIKLVEPSEKRYEGNDSSGSKDRAHGKGLGDKIPRNYRFSEIAFLCGDA